MRAFIVFDDDGRAIGREMRSEDQPAVPGRVLEIPATEWFQYQEPSEFHLSSDEDTGLFRFVRRRRKVSLPRPTRQRMRGQPQLRWRRTEGAAETPWQPRTLYRKGDQVEGYEAQETGVSGLERPAFALNVVLECMPAVVWRRIRGQAHQSWQSYSVVEQGERIDTVDGAWEAAGAGVTGLVEPVWEGDEVEDRDAIVLPVPELDEPVVLRVGDQRRTVGPEGLLLHATEPTRLSVRLDSPGHYSDPYIIVVEAP